MVKTKAVMLSIILLNPLLAWAIQDHAKYALYTGTVGAIVLSTVAVIIDRVYSERSLKNKERQLQLQAQRIEQEHNITLKESEDTLKEASVRYNNDSTLQDEAKNSGVPLFQIVQNAVNDREKLIKAQSHLQEVYKQECALLIDIISEKIKDVSQHLIDQSAQEYQQRQEQKTIIAYKDDKRKLKLKRLKILVDQEQARLSLTSKKEDAYKCVVNQLDAIRNELTALNSKISHIDKRIDKI